jgi:hypothetical protein
MKKMIIIVLVIALSGLMFAPKDTQADNTGNYMVYGGIMVGMMVVMMVVVPKLIVGLESDNKITAYNSDVDVNNNDNYIHGSLINYQKGDDIFNLLPDSQK